VTPIEMELADLDGFLDAPSGAGVAPVVAAQLRADAAAGFAPRRPRRRWWAIVVAALVAAVGGAVAAPAVADWFGVRGVEVHKAPNPTPTTVQTPPPLPPVGTALDLGQPVATLAAASAAAGFEPVVPELLGPPDGVWVDTRGVAPSVSLVYEGGPLVTEFDATIVEGPILSKVTRPETTVEPLRINGEPALWIDGVHDVILRVPNGDLVSERLRLSDRVLLVQHGRLTIRIETNGGRDEAIRIAESLPR